jgi:cysteinyl-tRNA synthetase
MDEVGARRLAEARAEKRRSKDFAEADRLRDEIRELGYVVVDGPDGFELELLPSRVRRIHPEHVESILDERPIDDFSVQWLVQGWPEDVLRGVSSFKGFQGERRVQQVIVDAAGTHPSYFPSYVDEVLLEDDFGWGVERNAGLRRATGKIIVVVDGSVEAIGDVFSPIEKALSDPTVGVVGPFGIVSEDLREFREDPGPEVDAIQGYLMAFRREILEEAGFFDEKFKFYRTADIEYSFRIKDAGYRAVVVPLPVEKHEHRMWNSTPATERERLSKRNFYRFLERWRGRTDLTVSGRTLGQ